VTRSYYNITEVLSLLQKYKQKMIAHNGDNHRNKLYNIIHLDDNNKEKSVFFSLHQNQNIFFSNIGNQNIFLEKKHNPPPKKLRREATEDLEPGGQTRYIVLTEWNILLNAVELIIF
jgi:DNA polymerase III delta subunit